MKKLSVFIISIITAPLVLAQSRAYRYVAPSSSSATEAKQGVNTDKIENDLNNAQANKETQNIQRQADKASSNQELSMLISTGAAAYAGYQAFARYSACCNGMNYGCCNEAVLWTIGSAAAGAQARNMSKAKSISDSSRDAVTTGAFNPSSLNPQDPDKAAEEIMRNNPDIKEAQKHLDKVKDKTGMTVDLVKGTITKSDGTVVDLNKSSPSASADLGLTPEQMGQLSAMVGEAFKEAEKKVGSAGLDKLEGDTIVSGSGSTATVSTDFVESSMDFGRAAAPREAKINRDPAQIAGLSKKYNGDLIGVAEENIFTLINRRYEVKAKTDHFILRGK
jgi:hypothetical protein